MAVKDEHLIYPTEGLILKKSRKHYKVAVRSQHWQLRSLISAEASNIIYFPGGSNCNHVQRLDTETHECETIKLLTFSPRCLVAEKGWVCCGGETGEFTAIALDGLESELERGSLRSAALAAATAAAEALDAEPANSIADLLPGRTGARSNKTLIAKSMKLAGDRVNCITLWFPPDHIAANDCVFPMPVAVLANNDRTVTLVNLIDFYNYSKIEPFEVIKYPDYVNRAVISPDGSLLIAILDDPFLYVHRRQAKYPDQNRGLGSREAIEYQWEPSAQILLKSQRREDGSDSRGSFAACFNSSGTLLAIGTQYGTISIFDTATLGHPTADPLIACFQSSRPEEGPGAVRDMAFSPGPYDLLAWTEDRGHVGVADIRSNFVTRQILDISAEEDFEHIPILDRNTIDPRLLESRHERSDLLATNLSSALSISNEARRRAGGDAPEGLGRPLTSEETAVLEALQDERRRSEQRALRTLERTHPQLMAHPQLTWSDRARAARASSPGGNVDAGTGPGEGTGVGAGPSRERSSSVARGTAGAGSQRERARSVSRAIGDLLGNIRDQRERATERVRSAQLLLREAQARETLARERLEAERGSGSVSGVAAPPPRRVPGTTAAAAAPRTTTATATATTTAAGGSTTRTTGGTAAAGSGPWSELEALYSLSFDASAGTWEVGRGGELEREGLRRDRDRDRASLLPLLTHVYGRDWDEASAIRRWQGVHETPPQPDNTAGLSWSDDGRILFVGAENGIYEFHVNVQSRKFVPSISMR